MCRYYRRSYVELQRNDATTRSPVYAHFSETLTGVETVRAYGLQKKFTTKSDDQIDFNHRWDALFSLWGLLTGASADCGRLLGSSVHWGACGLQHYTSQPFGTASQPLVAVALSATRHCPHRRVRLRMLFVGCASSRLSAEPLMQHASQ